MGVTFLFFLLPPPILIPSCIKRTDVGKLINKSLGDSRVTFAFRGCEEGRGDVLWDHTHSASQYASVAHNAGV